MPELHPLHDTQTPAKLGLGLAAAIATTGVATAVTLVLRPVLYPNVTPPFLLAITATALLSGLGPGLLATVLSALVVNYWFFDPFGAFGLTSTVDLIRQLAFWVTGALVAVLCARSRLAGLRAQARAARAATEAAHARQRCGAIFPSQLSDEPGAPLGSSGASPESVQRDGAEEPPPADKTVLVVETDDAVRQLACRTLDRHGYRWLSASDGIEALELLERYDFPIDLVVTDVAMPEMSGQELISQLTERRPGASVLYTSELRRDEVAKRGWLEPGRRFIQKPFTSDALVWKVREVLDHERAPTGP